MSSKTNTLPNPLRNYRRRRTKRSLTHSRRRFHRRHNAGGRPGDSTPGCSEVSTKLEALQSLIPPQSTAGHGQPRQPDQLFKDTADYIVVLKTQVVILQKLVDFFGSACSDSQNQNAVAS